MEENLLKLDQSYCWHPFTQAAFGLPNTLIEKTEGIYLYDQQGKAYIDGISSWWVVTHGHNHPKIVAAIQQQAAKLSHTMFSGLTHEPAIRLAKYLIEDLQSKKIDMQWAFFSDNGSTAIEAALKMACQYWHNQGMQRSQFLAFEGSYHGDTFGAMAVGKTSGFYKAFDNWLFSVDFIDYPEIINNPNNPNNPNNNFNNLNINLNEDELNILNKLEAYLQINHQKVAAFIFEPLVQGAAGMRFANITFLQQVLACLKKYNILIIADEVMTGFGRTGKLFACEYLLPEMPDIICLSKGITGGFLPLGATLVNDKIYQAFLNQDVYKAFLHGHSYTANPLACAAACANFELFQTENTLHQIELLSQAQQTCLNNLGKKLNDQYENPRVLGGIAAFNGLHLNFQATQNGQSFHQYGQQLAQVLRTSLMQAGVLLRPLGDCLYIMPPYAIKTHELEKIYDSIFEVIQMLNSNSPKIQDSKISKIYKNPKISETTAKDLF